MSEDSPPGNGQTVGGFPHYMMNTTIGLSLLVGAAGGGFSVAGWRNPEIRKAPHRGLSTAGTVLAGGGIMVALAQASDWR